MITRETDMADVAVIGGTGFYTFLDAAEDVPVTTRFGTPSAPITIGDVAGRRTAFLPRHGAAHEFPPHLVNYRANLLALHMLGVRRVYAPSAVGSLVPELGPGSLVVPDQVVDRTSGRAHTVHDAPNGARHVDFADPYCPRGREAVLAAAGDLGTEAVDGGTMVVINGPRFSSRAESRWHAAQGWCVVGMTGMPEAGIARELGMCYTSVAIVTDRDAGDEAGSGVTEQQVYRQFTRSLDTLTALLRATLAAASDDPACPCRQAGDLTPD